MSSFPQETIDCSRRLLYNYAKLKNNVYLYKLKSLKGLKL
jgi:hypothetical protein